MNSSDSPSFTLLPSQAAALEFLLSWFPKAPVLSLTCSGSRGRTTVLQEFARRTNAGWIDVRQFIAEVIQGHPLAIEDAAHRLMASAFKQHSRIVIDDVHLLYDYASSCNHYPRSNFYECVMRAIQLEATEKNIQLILGSNGHLPKAFRTRALTTSIERFGVDDYRQLFQAKLGELPKIDFDAVHRFAPHLDCHRIVRLCRLFESQPTKTTDHFLNYIQSQGMSSNVELDEVQPVALKDLCGIDDIIEALEDNIILPIENLQLTAELGLTPKRGVMLAGPPGTGKTTIGRALARRMRGKFFLIDGTFISGTEYFYYRIDQVFREAIANAPSIVFIDDSDVIFESGREHGLYRYLLTKLDGLESESANSVCVMMTAMDLGNIPPALVRSGRIELWLEMRLPDAASRRRLMQNLFADKVRLKDDSAWPQIEQATEGFTGADLKRLMQDAKLRLAVDTVRQRSVKSLETYLLAAAATIRDSRRAYANSVERASLANEQRPRWFNIHPELFENSNANE